MFSLMFQALQAHGKIPIRDVPSKGKDSGEDKDKAHITLNSNKSSKSKLQ